MPGGLADDVRARRRDFSTMPTDPTTQAMLPPDATWAGVILLLIGGLFLAGITIGVVARIVLPERYGEPPPQH